MQKLKPDFAPEWIALALVALLDLVWARAIGFHLVITWLDGKLLGLAFAILLTLKLAPLRGTFIKSRTMVEYFSLTTVATLVFATLSYLSLASSGPVMIDDHLMAADRAMGFDWMAGYHFLKAHPAITRVLQIAYESLVYQGLYFCVLFSLMGDLRRLREMFWVFTVGALLTGLVVFLFPTFGPYKALGTAPPGSFLVDAELLKNGVRSFALAKLAGVVSFPSFHTTMALAYFWGFRKAGPIFWPMLVLNLLMLVAVPWFGGHYLCDMLGGSAVMLVSLAVVKFGPRLFQPTPSLSPVTA